MGIFVWISFVLIIYLILQFYVWESVFQKQPAPHIPFIYGYENGEFLLCMTGH